MTFDERVVMYARTGLYLDAEGNLGNQQGQVVVCNNVDLEQLTQQEDGQDEWADELDDRLDSIESRLDAIEDKLQRVREALE